MDKIGESFSVITGTNDGTMSVAGARWAALITCVASLVVASKVTRGRVEEMQEPIFGVLF